MKGEVLFEGRRCIDAFKLEELATALGTSSAADTATLVPYFGPTVVGEEPFVDALEVDFARALLGGISYRWERPFRPGELIDIRLWVEDMYRKGNLQFAVVTAEFRDPAGAMVQVQRATFIEQEVS
jgi:acyl dehydratase